MSERSAATMSKKNGSSALASAFLAPRSSGRDKHWNAPRSASVTCRPPDPGSQAEKRERSPWRFDTSSSVLTSCAVEVACSALLDAAQRVAVAEAETDLAQVERPDHDRDLDRDLLFSR